MSYRRRSVQQLVVPYPFLNDPTNLAILGIENKYKPIPEAVETGQWYLVSEPTPITVLANKTLIVVRTVNNRQRLFWEEAGIQTQEQLAADDYVLIYDGNLPVVTIAGFVLMSLGDRSSAVVNNGLLQFPTNIRFNFTASE